MHTTLLPPFSLQRVHCPISRSHQRRSPPTSTCHFPQRQSSISVTHPPARNTITTVGLNGPKQVWSPLHPLIWPVKFSYIRLYSINMTRNIAKLLVSISPYPIRIYLVLTYFQLVQLDIILFLVRSLNVSKFLRLNVVWMWSKVSQWRQIMFTNQSPLFVQELWFCSVTWRYREIPLHIWTTTQPPKLKILAASQIRWQLLGRVRSGGWYLARLVRCFGGGHLGCRSQPRGPTTSPVNGLHAIRRTMTDEGFRRY